MGGSNAISVGNNGGKGISGFDRRSFVAPDVGYATSYLTMSGFSVIGGKKR